MSEDYLIKGFFVTKKNREQEYIVIQEILDEEFENEIVQEARRMIEKSSNLSQSYISANDKLCCHYQPLQKTR